jgi:membrane protease YdiL (CAAX protease family)
MTESVPDIARADLPRTPPQPAIWGPWLTLAWGVGGFVVMFIAQAIAVVAFILAEFVPAEKFLADPMSLEKDPMLLSLAQFASTPFVVAYFAFAARASRLKVSDYLALKWPRVKHVVIGAGAMVAALIIADLVSVAAGHEVTSSAMNEVILSARDPTTMVLLALAVVVLAPLQEEIFFRGFLFPGFAQGMGAWLAIIVTSAIWASLHVQYDLFFMGQIFAMGVLIGWLRWWSGSTLLTIILHAGVNAAAIVQTHAMAG